MDTMRRAFVCAAACSLVGLPLRAQDAVRSVWDGVYTAEQAQRGASEYASHCVSCHGEHLEGNGGEAPALSGKTFLYNWDSLAVQALFDRIHSTMPMSDPGSLSAQQAADLTAYILSMNQMPAGATALSSDEPTLQSIRFNARRPNH